MLSQQTQFLEEKVTQFVESIQRRNRRETLVACILIAIFALDFSYSIYRQREDILSIIGGALIIFALLLNLTVIWWKLSIPKSELSAFPPAQFPERWRYHLTRQARMLKFAWLWYLLPLFLGLSVYLLGVYRESSGSVILLILAIAVLFFGAWRSNIKAARRFERDRDTWFNSSPIA